MSNRDHLKTWRMSLPEDSPVWQDLLDLGRELGVQPAEAARVALTKWSRAMRGRIALGGAGVLLPQAPRATPTETAVTKGTVEREQDKAKGTRFAGTLGLDDDE